MENFHLPELGIGEESAVAPGAGQEERVDIPLRQPRSNDLHHSRHRRSSPCQRFLFIPCRHYSRLMLSTSLRLSLSFLPQLSRSRSRSLFLSSFLCVTSLFEFYHRPFDKNRTNKEQVYNARDTLFVLI